MLKLYHCKNARSLRPLWMLEELGLPYELTVLPFPPRVFAKEYLAINPLGTIPCFFDGEVRMTESAAICQYLVDKFGKSQGKEDLGIPVADAAYGEYLNWLYFADATLTFPQTIVLRYSQLEPEARRLPQAAADYRAWFYGRLRAVAAALANRDYLCAGRFTAADVAVGYGLFLATNIGIDGDFPPHIRDYLTRLTSREAFVRAVNK